MFIKILALALIGTLLSVLLKKYCKELIPFFAAVIVIASVYIIFDEASFENTAIRKIFALYSQSEDLFACLFKGAAVTVLTKLATDVCRESGNGLMGDIVEFGGRITLMILSMPYIEKVTQTALAFVK